MKKLVVASLTVVSTLCLAALQARGAEHKDVQPGSMEGPSAPGATESFRVSGAENMLALGAVTPEGGTGLGVSADRACLKPQPVE
jgi:hypothetical protein